MKAIPRRVWLFAVLYLLVASLPYMVGCLNAPPGGAFTGNAFEQTRVDYNSHLAKIQIGLRGEWGDQILFTPEPHPGVLTKTFYIALGHLARLFALSPVLVYHLARIVSVLAMVIAIWLFVSHYLPDERGRWLALLLATVTGGLGWLLYLIAPSRTAALAPIEFWLLDAYTFLAALTFPHFAAAIAVLLGFMLVLEHWLYAPTWKNALGLAALSLLVGMLQPFDLLLTALIVAIMVLWAWWRKRLHFVQGLMLLPAAFMHVLVVVYDYTALNSHPVWRAFTAQNITLSPPPQYYLLGYFWLLIPAAVGVAVLWRRREARLLLPIVWVLLTALLVYAPLQTQRRFLMGVQVPLAVLAAVGLLAAWDWWLARGGAVSRWRIALTTGLLFSTMTHILLLLSSIGSVNPAARPLLFLSRDKLAALDWLREQPQETVIFSTFPAGGEAVAFTGRRAYIGHWIETMDFEARQAEVAAFFDAGMTDAERLALLHDAGADYVWMDDTARALGDWSPEGVDFLTPAFESDSVMVYEVMR